MPDVHDYKSYNDPVSDVHLMSHKPSINKRQMHQNLPNSRPQERPVPILHTIKEKKPCKDGKIRNPITGRCIMLKNAEKKNLVKRKIDVPATKPVPILHTVKGKKPCKDGKIRNPITGRCIMLKNAEKKNLIKRKRN